MPKTLATFIDITAEAWWELKRARLRTYLALLGIVVGALGLTVLVCTLHLENALRGEQDITTLDIHMPTLEDYNRTIFRRVPRLKRYELTPADGEAIQKECPEVEQVLLRGVLYADFKGREWHQAALTSTNIARPEYFRRALPPTSDAAWALAWGRIFTPEDMARAAPVVVIDQRMASKLWPKSPRVLSNGQLGSPYLHINGVRFDVIGVVSGGLGEGTAIIPYTTMQRLFWNANWYLSAIPKRGFLKAAARHIDRILTARIGDPGYTFVSLPGVSYEELKVYLFFGIVGALVLLSAGAAVSNKAYIDALERMPQFAVRRALGATKARIYAVVLMESTLVCGFGCLYGGIIGWMVFASFTAERWILRDIWYALPVLPLAAVFLFVIAVGVLGSLQGAAVAANANPAEVLAGKEVV